uniref:WAP four-disulfide core domain protein 5 n=1 Tax=Pogona vitticeps TaxID=103695 RepID=A0ABM5G4N3_9SAUR
MKTLTAFLLVGLLALWTELPSTTSVKLPKELSKICQGTPFPCSIPGIIHRCRSDDDCPQNLRCCNYRCSRRCRIPLLPPVIPWSCPQNPIKCTAPGIDRCRYDYDCPKKQRCCYYNCARTCV